SRRLFTYDVEGRMIRDSVAYPYTNTKFVTAYTYHGNKIDAVSYLRNAAIDTLTKSFGLLGKNDWLTQIEETAYYNNTPSTCTRYSYNYNEYGNVLNYKMEVSASPTMPFYKVEQMVHKYDYHKLIDWIHTEDSIAIGWRRSTQFQITSNANPLMDTGYIDYIFNGQAVRERLLFGEQQFNLGVSRSEPKQLSVFPNPANGLLNLTVPVKCDVIN